MNPFEKYKVYGPTYHKRIDRYMIFLVSPEHRTSMTYARYLMCVKEERWLGPEEEVDHIDDNRLNDDIDNLQILTRAENMKKAGRPTTYVDFVCPMCDKLFKLSARQSHKVNPCCSRSCGGKKSALTTRGYTSVVRRSDS